MTMQLTQVYLEREQKKALQARAKANGTKVAEEVRRAIDAYLSGISPDDLRLLDAGTRKAERDLVEMADELARLNAALDAGLDRLTRSPINRSHRAKRPA
jgi:F0F1-type ATP synthase membrane subunit b/b'